MFSSGDDGEDGRKNQLGIFDSGEQTKIKDRAYRQAAKDIVQKSAKLFFGKDITDNTKIRPTTLG